MFVYHLTEENPVARFDQLLSNIAIEVIFNENNSKFLITQKLGRTLVKNGLGVHNVECNINKHALKSIRRAGIHEPKHQAE